MAMIRKTWQIPPDQAKQIEGIALRAFLKNESAAVRHLLELGIQKHREDLREKALKE